jgi:hypothetical protein
MVSVGAWRRNDSKIGACVEMTFSKVERRRSPVGISSSFSVETEHALDDRLDDSDPQGLLVELRKSFCSAARDIARRKSIRRGYSR